MTTSLKLLTNIKLSGDFVGEAAIDSIRCLARAMQSSVMARRVLWLKPWTAHISSKVNWCRIPFDGTVLFGNKMESAISKVTGGKSGMLPQDLKPKQRRFQGRKQYPNKVREFRHFRPLKEYKKDGRTPQTTVARMPKTGSTSEQQKPF